MSDDPRRSRPLIHSRESSSDSRVSNSSRSSEEARSPSSRTEMANVYYETRKVESRDRTEHLRVPDNDRHYITAITSADGKTKVYDHQKGIYDPAAPRSSDARYEDYRRSQQRERDLERRYREQQRRSGY